MTNKTEIQNYLLTTIDDSMDTQLTSWIAQVTAMIETMTNRQFSQEAEPSERIFDGNGRCEILVDEFTELDTVEVDGTELTDIKQYPANADVKYKLYSERGFTRGKQNVVISALWGEPVPADLKFAATVLVSGIIQYAGPKAPGNVTQERIGNYSVSYSNDQQASDFARAKEIIALNKKYFI